MQPNKSKLALTIGVLLFAASNSSSAASLTPNVKVTTRDDVTLSQVQAMSFGSNLFIAAGGVCLMDADTPGDVVGQANGLTTQANYGELSGTGCADGNIATPGVYKIAGTAASTVTVTVTPLNANGAFTYVPNNGCVVVYNNTAGANETCTALSASPIVTALAGALDNGSAVAGEGIVVIGGTVTIGGAPLTASTGYTDSFSLNVVY